MPPLECANFLECENKTVCVAPFGSLRPSFWIQPKFFPSYTRKLSQFTLLSFFLFLAKMAWNAIVCETTDVSRENSIFPIFQKTWFQAILSKKTEKKKKNTEYDDFMECEDLAECVNFTVCVRPSLWSAMSHVECEEIMECEEFWVCVAGIETTEGNFGARTKIPIPKPAQTSRGTPVGFIFRSSPWVRPRGRNWLIFTQPTFKNVTFDNPVLLR